MNAPKALRGAIVAFLLAGVLFVAVPAAAVSGLKLTTGEPSTVAGPVVEVPVQVSNGGFLGIRVSGLHVDVLDGKLVLLSQDVGSIDIGAGKTVNLEVPFLIVSSSKQLLGNLSGALTGDAEIGGLFPVGLTVTSKVAYAVRAPEIGEAAAWTAALFAYAAGAGGAGDITRARRAYRGASGVAVAALLVLVLLVAPRYAGGAISGFASQAAGQGGGIALRSGFADFVLGIPYAALVVAIAGTEAALKGSGAGARTKGAIKAVEGALLAVLSYLLFGGGVTPVGLSSGAVSATFAVGVVLPLALFEAAAGARIVEGALEAMAPSRRVRGPHLRPSVPGGPGPTKLN